MCAAPLEPGLIVALVQPTTLLGRDVRAVLKERGFPVSKLLLFHTLAKPEGIVTADEDEAVFVAPLSDDALETSQVAFFCGDPDGTARFFRERIDDCLAIDLSGLRSGGPFVSPGQPGTLPAGNVFLTYDPTALVLADLVRALDGLRRVAAVTAAIDRPVSELGVAALDELFRQAIALATFKPIPKEILGTQSAFNIYAPPDAGGYEARVAEDFQALLGRAVPTVVLSSRAGVFHGHHVRLAARFDGPAPSEAEIRAALFGPDSELEAVDPENLSGPVESAGRDETLVLSIRSSGGSARIHFASDHFRRGGALMAVRTAERAVAERRLLG